MIRPTLAGIGQMSLLLMRGTIMGRNFHCPWTCLGYNANAQTFRIVFKNEMTTFRKNPRLGLRQMKMSAPAAKTLNAQSRPQR